MTDSLADLLRDRPLPSADGDKHDRGVLVVVAGAPSCPGAAVLATEAALRAGAGKVQLLTHPALVTAVGVAVPEALVVPWAPVEPPDDEAHDLLRAADAVLVGPGLGDGAEAAVAHVDQALPAEVPLLLDARALGGARHLDRRPLVLLPNPDEAAALVDDDDPRVGVDLAVALARSLQATVALRGSETWVTDGRRAWSSTGHAGLGTAGSGDVLAGVAAGLVARHLDPVAAVGWAVAAHAAAGVLADEARDGPGYGYLARDLVEQVPTALGCLGREVKTSKWG